MRARLRAALIAALLLSAPGTPRADIDLWPLLETGDDRLTILYPFYVREGTFRMSFPLYYQTNEGRDRHFLWPFVKVSEGRLERVAPVWFSGEEGSYTFLPFIHRDEERTVTLLPPMYTERDGSVRAILPLYARTPNSLYTLPGYYRRRPPGEPEVDGVLGLFKSTRGPHEAKASALLWSYYSRRTPTSSTRGLGYLFWHTESPDERLTVLAPLFFRREKGEQRHTFLLPYYQARGPEVTSTFVLPFYGRTRSKDLERDVFFPIFAQSRRSAPQRVTNTHLLWPLYQRRQTVDGNGDIVALYRRFLLFSDRREEDGTRVFSILGLPIIERTPS